MYILFSLSVSGASHSAVGDMKTITQETSSKTITAVEPRSRDLDIERDIISLDELLSIASNNYFNNTSSKLSRSNEDVVIVTELELPKRPTPSSRAASSVKKDAKKDLSSAVEGEAQKKFGSAKAISSAQYFQDSASDNAVSAHWRIIEWRVDTYFVKTFFNSLLCAWFFENDH